MKCQSLFSGENEKNIINLSSAKFVHSMVSVKINHHIAQSDHSSQPA